MNEAIIRTYTGKLVDIFNLKEDDIHIFDIAHSLSFQCRYNGHINKFRSVAHHSINVVDLLFNTSRNTRLAALLHDAAETYLGDIPSPLKKYLYISDRPFVSVEDDIIATIYRKFNVVDDYDVKYHVPMADKWQLSLEKKNPDLWTGEPTIPSYCITMEQMFLDKFKELSI